MAATRRRFEAIAVYDELLARFGAAAERQPREQVAMALVAKAEAFAQLERYAEADEAYDDVLARFADAPESEPELSKLVDVARIGKSLTLLKLGRHMESLALSRELLGHLGATLNPPVQPE